TVQKPIRIFVVNSDRLFCDALRTLIASWPGYSHVGDAATVEASITALDAIGVDIVLLEIDLPGEPGFSLLQYLTENQRTERAVVLTRELHPEYIREALRLGASGYLSHGAGSEQIRNALCAISEGRAAIDPLVCKALAEDPIRDCITDRECQVLTLIAEGACNAEIAQRFGITEKTVKTHVSSLLGKLGMSSRVHLAVYAQDTSLLKPPRAG
ncbi:MAG: DNA-binding response regulator, partial [Halomonas sp.]